MSLAYPSGQLQKSILDSLSFKGDVVITHGVGLSNFEGKGKNRNPEREEVNTRRFIYVGRISEEKNVALLVDAFKHVPYQLVLVGDGDLKSELELKATENVKFVGYIDNLKLEAMFTSSDCFILPSLSEPWGLVVEEALTFGLPVIVSNKVGCSGDLINAENGIVFDAFNQESLISAMKEIDSNYEKFIDGAYKYDSKKMAEAQIEAYVSSM